MRTGAEQESKDSITSSKCHELFCFADGSLHVFRAAAGRLLVWVSPDWVEAWELTPDPRRASERRGATSRGDGYFLIT